MIVDAMKPSLPLLVKLGSIIVHAEELLSPDGHDFDLVAWQELIADAEVQEWFKQMRLDALLPERRSK